MTEFQETDAGAQIGGYLRVILVPWRNGVWTCGRVWEVLGAGGGQFPGWLSASRGPGGSGGAGFEPDGAEVVASGEVHVGVECGGQAP